MTSLTQTTAPATFAGLQDDEICHESSPLATLDHRYFPHIIENVAFADPEARNKLRMTCWDLRNNLKDPLFHVAISILSESSSGLDSLGNSPRGAIPALSARSTHLRVSTADGEVDGLGDHGLKEWYAVSKSRSLCGTAWKDRFTATRVDDFHRPRDMLPIYQWFYRSLANSMGTMINPAIARYAPDTFPLVSATKTVVAVVESTPTADWSISGDGNERIFVPQDLNQNHKLVIALRVGSLQLDNPAAVFPGLNQAYLNDLRHLVIHCVAFGPLGQCLLDKIAEFLSCLPPLLRVLPVRVELVGFGELPSLPPLNDGSEAVDVLQVTEYAKRHTLSDEVVALERGDDFLFAKNGITSS